MLEVIKRYWSFVFLLFSATCPYTPEQLITHTKQAIERAKKEQSKLTQAQLKLEGMSSVKVRHLLNNLCSLPDAHYFEIGVWKGSTFVSALYENKTIAHAVAVDNWSEFGVQRTTLFSNVTTFLDITPIEIIERDAFTLTKEDIGLDPIDIYFYDGSTTLESVKKAFIHFNELFADVFIVLVDDYNQPEVQCGVKEAFNKLQYDVLYEEQLPAYYNGDVHNWWNGVYVAVVQKHGSGKRPASSPQATNEVARDVLKQWYEYHAKNPSDIYQHLPILKNFTMQCSSVLEVGVRNMVSTWAFLQGLTESDAQKRFYIGIDLVFPPQEVFAMAERLAQENGVAFYFWAQNDMTIDDDVVPEVDFVFIDSLHTYCHATYELEKFSPKTKKYIALHDTSAPWGNTDDTEYHGDYSEYPVWYDRTKRGLWPAVQDFLQRHAEWQLEIRYFNCHGLTVLKRVGVEHE